MKKMVLLLYIAVTFLLMGCVADVPGDTTAAINAPLTVSTMNAATEPTTAPTVPTETQAPTEATTAPTEPEEEEPRQDGLRLSDEQLAYFEELFLPPAGPPPVESYYNLALAQDFASIREIDLFYFFEDGSPEDMKYGITQSEVDYYKQNTVNANCSPHIMKRLSYAFVTDVLQRYLGVTVPQMDMHTLVYNPNTGYYYCGHSSESGAGPAEFADGYYDEETGLLSLYYLTSNTFGRKKERIVTLRYIPEAEITKFQLVSNLPVK